MLLIVALCVIVPIVELFVFVQVAEWIGVAEALLLLLVVSVLGAWLVKHQGVSVFRQGRSEVAAGRIPGRSLVDGVLIAGAGVLLLVPGFVTAIVGLLLLVPLTRVPFRNSLIRRWSRRVSTRRVRVTGSNGAVWVDGVVVSDRRSDAQELGRDRAIEAGDEPIG